MNSATTPKMQKTPKKHEVFTEFSVVRPEGVEPPTFGSEVRRKHRENKGFASVVAQMVATDIPENGCERLISAAETDPELARVVTAWPKLSAVVKRMILAALDADQGHVAPKGE